MEKIIIRNSKGQKIAVLLEQAQGQKGLVFVMHGLGGFKEQEHIATFARAFQNKGFTVFRFDTTNTLGESEGRFEDATITSYYEDLEDVIKWASGQSWYQEPFALAGHSLGGICTALYAERYPEKVFALAPIATVVSGQLTVESHKRHEPEVFKKWHETGWREDVSTSRPGVIRRLPWSHLTDRLQYDLLPHADKLTMPVLLIVGDNDTSTPPEHIRKLFEALPGPKQMHVIQGAPHTFRDPKHLREIETLMTAWIDSFLYGRSGT